MIEIPRCPHLTPGKPARQIIHAPDGWHMAVCGACYVLWKQASRGINDAARTHGLTYRIGGAA